MNNCSFDSLRLHRPYIVNTARRSRRGEGKGGHVRHAGRRRPDEEVPSAGHGAALGGRSLQVGAEHLRGGCAGREG